MPAPRAFVGTTRLAQRRGTVWPRVLAVVLLLFIAGCSGSSGKPAAQATATASANDATPTDAYIAAQFKIQVDMLATDAATYNADVAKGDDASAIQDSGTLYSEVAGFPGVLGVIAGTKGKDAMPAVVSASKIYADALSNVNGGTVGHLKSAEASVPAAANQFKQALVAFAAAFGGTVPEV